MLLREPDENNISGKGAMNKTGFTFFGVITSALSECAAKVYIVHADHALHAIYGSNLINVHFANMPPGKTVNDLEKQELVITVRSLPLHAGDIVKAVFESAGSLEQFIARDIENISRKHLELFIEQMRQTTTPAGENTRFQSRVTLLHGDEFLHGAAEVETGILHGSGYIRFYDCPTLVNLGLPLSFTTRTQRMSLGNDGVLIVLGQCSHLGDYVLWVTGQ